MDKLKKQIQTLNKRVSEQASVKTSPDALMGAASAALPYALAMMDPEAHEPVRPSDGYSGRTALCHVPFELELGTNQRWDPIDCKSYGDEVETVTVVTPSLIDNVWTSSGSDITWSGYADGSDIYYYMEPHFVGTEKPNDIGDAKQVEIQHPMRLTTREGSLPVGIIPRMGALNGTQVPWYELGHGFAAGSLMFVTVVHGNEFQFSEILAPPHGSVTVSYRNSLGTVHSQSQIINGSTASYDFGGGGFDMQSFSIAIDCKPGIDLAVKVMFLTNTPTITLTPKASCYRIFGSEHLKNLSAIKARTTALSALFSYRGDQLNDGGQLASAHLPSLSSVFVAPGGDYYKYITDGAADYYSGRSSTGSYVWWAPLDQIVQDFTPYGNSNTLRNNTELLFFVATRSDPDQKFILKVDQHAEYTSESPVIERAKGTVNISFDTVMHIVKSQKHCLENEEHKGILKRIWGKVKDTVTKPANWWKAANWAFKRFIL